MSSPITTYTIATKSYITATNTLQEPYTKDEQKKYEELRSSDPNHYEWVNRIMKETNFPFIEFLHKAKTQRMEWNVDDSKLKEQLLSEQLRNTMNTSPPH
jgi:hypothetical protein